MPYNELGLMAGFQRAVAAQGRIRSSPIQTAGIPVILHGRGVDVLVTAPGYLLEHAVVLSAEGILMPDEADRMLNMGVIHNIRKVSALLSGWCQNLLERSRGLRRRRRERSLCYYLHRRSNTRRWGRRTRRRCGKSLSPEAEKRTTPNPATTASPLPIHCSLRTSSVRVPDLPSFGLRALSTVSTKFASNGKSLSCPVC